MKQSLSEPQGPGRGENSLRSEALLHSLSALGYRHLPLSDLSQAALSPDFQKDDFCLPGSQRN